MKPQNFILRQFTTNALTFGTNSNVWGVIIAPYSQVTFNNGAHFYGAIICDQLSMTSSFGDVRLYYDKDLINTSLLPTVPGDTGTGGMKLAGWQDLP